jgi:3-oxoadipate enol-lactonase
VRGLVLCSTAASFAVSREERLSFLGLTGLAVLARLTPNQTIDWLTEQLYMQRKGEGLEPWAIEQMASHDWRKIIEAGSAIGNFDSTSWLKDVDVPASVVITTKDQVVAVDRQQRLIELLDDVDAHFIDGAHNAVYTDHRTYVPMLLAAITSVHQRSKLLL